MLSEVPFKDLYDEVNLKKLKNRDLTILSLINLNENLGNKQIHKLLFLTFVEGKILLPFKFVKKDHGPFSLEIRDSLINLQDKGLIVEIPEKVGDYTQKTKELTEEGKEFIKSNKKAVDEIEKEIYQILFQHQTERGLTESANYLENYCYEKYLLKPSDKTEEEWLTIVRAKIKDIHTIINSREKELENIKGIEESKMILILSSFDYIKNILEILESNPKIDQVVRGVLIKTSQEYLDLWGELFILEKSGEKTNKMMEILFRNRLLFKFLNEVSKEYGILESVFSEEGEIEDRGYSPY